MNLLFSYGADRDNELNAQGHIFLGAGEDSNEGEVHVFLKAGEERQLPGDNMVLNLSAEAND